MNACKKYFAIALLSILLASTNALGQRIITLKFARAKIILLPGDRVKCKFYDGSKYVGTLQNITETTFDLDNKTFFIDSVKSIGRRKKIAPIFGYTAMAATFILNLVVVGHTKSLGTVALAGLAEVIIIASVFINPTIGPGQNHILHRTAKWRVEVIEFNNQ